MAATLVAASTAAGSAVYPGRVYPLKANGPWPQLTISSQGEQLATRGLGGARIQERAYVVDVSGHAKTIDESAIEDMLDALGKEVEIALANNLTLSGTAKLLTLTQVVYEFSGDGDQPAGRLHMLYEITLYARENAPDVLA